MAQFFKSDNLLAIGWRHRDLTGYKKLYSDTLCKEYKLKNVITQEMEGICRDALYPLYNIIKSFLPYFCIVWGKKGRRAVQFKIHIFIYD